MNSWGQLYWNFLHSIATRYPNNPTHADKTGMLQFFQILPGLIPCKICRDHTLQFFHTNSASLPLVVASRENLFYFFWFFHNTVNKRLGKPIIELRNAKNLYNYFD